MKRLIPDSSFVISAVNSKDVHHLACYSYWKNSEYDVRWVVPDIVFFEFQAAQSRNYTGHEEPYRWLGFHTGNSERCPITGKLLGQIWEMKLYNMFSKLRGADLLFACVAKAKNLPLVTCDHHFEIYSDQLEIINPSTRKN